MPEIIDYDNAMGLPPDQRMHPLLNPQHDHPDNQSNYKLAAEHRPVGEEVLFLYALYP
jgi:hypothetical protein